MTNIEELKSKVMSADKIISDYKTQIVEVVGNCTTVQPKPEKS